MTDLGIEGRRVSIEAIATLVHIKMTMAELVLKPAGVPPEIYRPLLDRRDEVSGRPMSKRQIAPLILDAMESRPDCTGVIRRIVEITSRWSGFYLADDEFAARATVQKARELLGTIELMEAREARQREIAQKEELARMERERADLVSKHSELLLLMFDDLAMSTDHQRRGYLLQDLLNRLFDLHQIPVIGPFTRNHGAEQIDGMFTLEGWHYIVECRWRQKLADIREVDGLRGQVDRSGKQSMGLFLSVNGWSESVPQLLKQSPEKAILLMDGYDLRMVLASRVDPRDLILAKSAALAKGKPFLAIAEWLNSEQE
jgi:hypothetical protein